MRSREEREPDSVVIGTNPYIQPQLPNQVLDTDFDDDIELTRNIMANLPSRQCEY